MTDHALIRSAAFLAPKKLKKVQHAVLVIFIVEMTHNHGWWHKYCCMQDVNMFLAETAMKKQSGFTLVEIAIVLVIIGLLLGGVLKGQELINQAKIKNIANDLNGITAAVYSYQDRFKRFPGDDSGAAARWTSPLAVSGNGDAVVGAAGNTTVINCATDTGENCQFWHHLRLAGFVGGDTAAGATGAGKLSPQNAAGGVLHVQQGALGLSGLVVCTSNLLGKIAVAIDAQFDDGNAITGTVRGTSAAAGLAVNPPPANYVDDGATVYTVCKQV